MIKLYATITAASLALSMLSLNLASRALRLVKNQQELINQQTSCDEALDQSLLLYEKQKRIRLGQAAEF